MRQVYVVSYDIADPKRIRKVYRLLRGYGDHVQLSVFQCELNRTELLVLRSQLAELIHHDEDQVMFVDVGPVSGRGATSISAIGRPHVHPERVAIIV